MGEKKSIRITVATFIWILVGTIILAILSTSLTMYQALKKEVFNDEANANIVENSVQKEIIQEEQKEEIPVVEDVSEFELLFLKLENQKENKIYSPLSIKYALKMLEDGTNGESKEQISKLLGKTSLTKYVSNKNLSFANSFFIRDTYKSQVRESYINNLRNKYNAEVKFDSFESADSINNWINEKTFEIIPELTDDETVKTLDFALINALAIDMEWEYKFLNKYADNKYGNAYFLHEQIKRIPVEEHGFHDKSLDIYADENVCSNTFKNENEELEISGMRINATINNYDIIKDIGEENIKNIVSEEYRKFAKEEEYDRNHAYGDFPLSEDVSDEGIKKALDEFLPGYISDLKENYHKIGATTDFYVYTDEEVKVFAKDLKEYDGVTLQYIGIMPTKENLDAFIEKVDMKKINGYISNLKDVDEYADFNDGVVTKIYGYIPKFKFEYDLDLMKDLKSCGITDVFDMSKSDLSKMVEGKAVISTVLHKANIEFTQDGIKAAAASMLGGEGAGMPFDYFFDVPIEEIDITFDNPYMFLIRDVETNEIWFAGSVYEPLSWDEEPERIYAY